MSLEELQGFANAMRANAAVLVRDTSSFERRRATVPSTVDADRKIPLELYD
jgi:hypothetical protein